jgi:hypothetical protein
MAFGTYSQKLVDMSYAGVQLSGKVIGEFCTVELAKDQFTFVADGDGGGCFVQEADQSGMAKFVLHQQSPSNAAMMSIAAQQMAGTLGPKAFVVNDRNGSYQGQTVGYLKRQANTARGESVSNVTWEVVGAQVQQVGGGVA